ncbi:hypothetical protein PLESTB_001492800 [Pleodorina starrii]|uniref:Uncharacterized protein n=1 Tax=Pleodorina starrii TaxID=330485 RepID=A0A9W6F7T3_9CHLO|nr:hypothetical protein PLESTM_001451600 [Pleodorina starrii]GLC59489.1 hypothetical protein PLESTB_001492800 [Pleodorina starrii]GLC66309.1 hypothetical protein PLESTF_000410100 [Pleodorina starrii]
MHVVRQYDSTELRSWAGSLPTQTKPDPEIRTSRSRNPETNKFVVYLQSQSTLPPRRLPVMRARPVPGPEPGAGGPAANLRNSRTGNRASRPRLRPSRQRASRAPSHSPSPSHPTPCSYPRTLGGNPRQRLPGSAEGGAALPPRPPSLASTQIANTGRGGGPGGAGSNPP